MSASLILQIRRLIIDVPQEIVERVCHACESFEDWASVYNALNSGLYATNLNKQLSSLINEAQNAQYLPQQVGLALRAAKEVAESYKAQQVLEMVWTGPEIEPFSLRRTDEALLQMIMNARHTLTIVSFAMYKVNRVFEALKEALSRGVEIQFFLETDPEKITGNRELWIRSLPSGIQVYTWSDDYRLRNERGYYGALHAKIAIADDVSLLVSSANFTEHALSLNIELGLMVTGGRLPIQASQLLRNLVSKGIFIKDC